MKILFLLAGLALASSGCSHSMMRGTVAMKLDNKQAHVCLGDNAVKTGDEVFFFENKCTSRGGNDDRGGDFDCNLKKLGIGTVTKTLNKHYSLIQTDGSFPFDEGTLVERVTK